MHYCLNGGPGLPQKRDNEVAVKMHLVQCSRLHKTLARQLSDNVKKIKKAVIHLQKVVVRISHDGLALIVCTTKKNVKSPVEH